MKKRIYLKIKDLLITKGSAANMKLEIVLNNNISTKTLLFSPFEAYAFFEIPNSATDNILTITYHYAVKSNSNYFQINKYELKMSPKFLSKEIEKQLTIKFSLDKMTSMIIDKLSTEISISNGITLLIVDENSVKEKTFLEKNATLREVKVEKVDVKIETKPAESVPKKIEPEEEVSQDMSEEDEKIINEEMEIPGDARKYRLKSEIVRKSLQIDFETFNFNTSCRRCNYLERLVLAQRKDISALQNQVECFIRGNFADTGESVNIESENLLKEPIFAKIFQKPVDEEIPVESEKTGSASKKKATSAMSLKKGDSNMKILQKSGEEINIYTLDEDRIKRIQKYEQEIDNLRAQLFAMGQKVKGLEQVQQENNQLREQIAKTSEIRANLERQLIDEAYSYQKKIKNNLEKIDILVEEKQNMERINMALTLEKENLVNDTKKYVSQIKELEHSLEICKSNTDVSGNQSSLSSLLAQVNKVDKTRSEKNEEIIRIISCLNNSLNDLRAENIKLSSENHSMTSKLKELENNYEIKVRDIAEKNKKITELETNYLLLKAEHINSQEIMKHRDELQLKFNRLMEINYSNQENLTKVNNSYTEQVKILNEKNMQMDSEIQKLRIQISEKCKEVNDKQVRCEGLSQEIEKLNLTIQELNAKKLYAYTTDENNKILNETVKQIFEFNSRIINEINEFGDYMIKSADKNMTAQHYIRVLMRNLYQKEKEAKEYRKHLDIVDNNSMSEILYSPLKQDQIDMLLAELINAYPSKSRIKSKFIRESRGNYKYAGKKLAISLEGTKILIRYNNILLNFDDFIDRYGEESEPLVDKKSNRSISPNLAPNVTK